jgi:DNA-binding NtrC family response regulator
MILVLAPRGRDGPAIAEGLGRAGLAARVCRDAGELLEELEHGADAVVIAEEALLGAPAEAIGGWVSAQPPWSDMPFVLLTSHDPRPAPARERLLKALGNVSLLEHPVAALTLTSAVLAAVRARRRQYEVRAPLGGAGADRRWIVETSSTSGGVPEPEYQAMRDLVRARADIGRHHAGCGSS